MKSSFMKASNFVESYADEEGKNRTKQGYEFSKIEYSNITHYTKSIINKIWLDKVIVLAGLHITVQR